MKVYISGAISNQANPRPAFDIAAQALRAAGHEVINPYDLDHSTHGRAWADFMRVDIKALMDCDAVAMLPGWRGSRGASIECALAQDLGMMLAPMSLFLTMKAAA